MVNDSSGDVSRIRHRSGRSSTKVVRDDEIVEHRLEHLVHLAGRREEAALSRRSITFASASCSHRRWLNHRRELPRRLAGVHDSRLVDPDRRERLRALRALAWYPRSAPDS